MSTVAQAKRLAAAADRLQRADQRLWAAFEEHRAAVAEYNVASEALGGSQREGYTPPADLEHQAREGDDDE